MARTLGSDVPFFLSGLETALGTGRGDRLQHVTDLPRDYGVVLVPSDRGTPRPTCTPRASRTSCSTRRAAT